MFALIAIIALLWIAAVALWLLDNSSTELAVNIALAQDIVTHEHSTLPLAA